MDLGNHVLNSIVAGTVILDAGRIYLVGRNLEAVWSAEDTPRELQNFVDDDAYKEMRLDTISEARYEATHIAFDFGVKLLKLSLNFYPTIWNLTGESGNVSFKRAVCFYALDSFLTRAVFIPVAYADSVICKRIKDPLMIFLDAILKNAVNAAISAVSAIGIIYITDKFGVKAFIFVTIASSILGLLTGLLKITLKKLLLQPLRNDSLSEKLRALASHANFPIDVIFFDHKTRATSLDVCYDSYLGSQILTINETLLNYLTPEHITGLAAHEMGHWYHHHITFAQAFSIIHSACMCVVCVKSFGNDWIAGKFGFSESPHPVVPLYLSVYYIWPLAKAVLDGLFCIYKRRGEFLADDYACNEGHSANLRTSILTLAGQKKCYPIFDGWYSVWSYGYPTVFERLPRLDPRKRVSIGGHKFAEESKETSMGIR